METLPNELVNMILEFLDHENIMEISKFNTIYHSLIHNSKYPKKIKIIIDGENIEEILDTLEEWVHVFKFSISINWKFKGNPDFRNNFKLKLLGEREYLLGHVYSLDLSGTKIINVSAFENVRKLDLSCTRVFNVSMLGNVHTLNLSDTRVSDVSALGNVHKLDLSLTNVSDVSMLGNVHKLDLSWTKVSDVSALGNVHTLDLKYTQVVDFSALKNVVNLFK